MRRIHIFGASGSGTTTLGKALAKALCCAHFDTDDYFWLPTDPPFQDIREVTLRQAMLRADLEAQTAWVLSGSLCGWGDFAIPYFDLAIFLWIPHDLRMRRLERREHERYGDLINDPTNPRHQGYKDFMAWAAGYDTGGMETRSKVLHDAWMEGLPCETVRLEEEYSLETKVNTLLNHIAIK